MNLNKRYKWHKIMVDITVGAGLRLARQSLGEGGCLPANGVAR